ncbi:hypothetical protein Bca4012_058374 [Brassica carinata]
MSSSKGSSKRHSSSHSSSDDSSTNEVIAPKEEFGVDEDAKDAYYKALCSSLSSPQDIPIPRRPVRSPNAPLTPSMVSPCYLATLRKFYQVPSEVVFRIPILIASYELGMDLNPGDFEGLWATRTTGIEGSFRMAPKKNMAVIQGHTSHPKALFERFFFVRIDGESVEESYFHLFRREWNYKRANRILPPTPVDLFAKRDLLRSRPFFWNSFTIEWIRSATELHRSRAVSQPLDVPYDEEPVADVLPTQGRKNKSQKGKGDARRPFREIRRCQDGNLVSLQGKRAEPTRLPFLVIFSQTSLPVLLLTSR